MALFRKKKTPEEVFTPRSAEINAQMYIPRPELEERLVSSMRGTQHVLIYGASGTGKSWLYKKVLHDMGAFFEEINLANAARLGAINAALTNAIQRRGEATKTEYTEKKSAELNAAVAKGALEHAGKFEIGAKEPLESCLELARKLAGRAPAYMVMDNLDAIFEDERLMNELGDIITLLDDRNYSQYNVKLVIVGIPAEVKEYFSRIKNREAVSNRIREIPEVSRLSPNQVMELVSRGFRQELSFDVSEEDLQAIGEHIAWVTDGVPQRVHEYCLELAFKAERNDCTIQLYMLDEVDIEWRDVGLADAYVAIQAAMNERDTRVGRRNQTLYALGLMLSESFTSAEVEVVVNREFPNSTAGKTLNVSAILSDLANREPPIVRRSLKGNAFVFSDPRFRMCIRAMLRKYPDETVGELELGSIGG